MIRAVFQDHLAFLALAIAITLLAGVATYLLFSRRTNRTQAALYGLWASSTVGPLTLTTWAGSGLATGECTINPDVLEAFTGTQGQLNVLLLMPFGLFAALATRRPLFSAATGIVFIATVETSQAVAPFISRLCDSDDLATNTAGVLMGTIMGAVICRRIHSTQSMSKTTVQRTTAIGATTVVLITAAWATVIHPVRAVLPTKVPEATAAQVQALDGALNKAFEGTHRISKADFLETSGGKGTVTAQLHGGFAEITWPDREQFTAHFTPTYHGEGTYAYKVPDVSRPTHTAQEAERVATQYASQYAPWALRRSKVTVRAIDEKANIGWIVEWRRWRGEVLMPMRLDIVIEPSGGMTDLMVRHINDPELPQARISEAEAWKRFETRFKLKPSDGKREEPIYLAERRDGQWRIHWRLSFQDRNTLHSAVVDATDGSIHRNSSEVISQPQ
ncbi:VanZ family protein [Streptomyces lomondensis]|uniref:VanZ-like domain-containing protein n=1 Tax=Streptomyces lomondensis TaxID=68229 RepID=A0ABQ2XM87_9ACTN|nr:VanZ family protein [Streptomyces lomondensis]MCF0076426.1 VanZ family protein [Streptomyces lomondensis]GGX24621.1 hypothetical protein GCM10010383_63790 [Streptomyces lomondensis]